MELLVIVQFCSRTGPISCCTVCPEWANLEKNHYLQVLKSKNNPVSANESPKAGPIGGIRGFTRMREDGPEIARRADRVGVRTGWGFSPMHHWSELCPNVPSEGGINSTSGHTVCWCVWMYVCLCVCACVCSYVLVHACMHITNKQTYTSAEFIYSHTWPRNQPIN